MYPESPSPYCMVNALLGYIVGRAGNCRYLTKQGLLWHGKCQPVALLEHFLHPSLHDALYTVSSNRCCKQQQAWICHCLGHRHNTHYPEVVWQWCNDDNVPLLIASRRVRFVAVGSQGWTGGPIWCQRASITRPYLLCWVVHPDMEASKSAAAKSPMQTWGQTSSSSKVPLALCSASVGCSGNRFATTASTVARQFRVGLWK